MCSREDGGGVNFGLMGMDVGCTRAPAIDAGHADITEMHVRYACGWHANIRGLATQPFKPPRMGLIIPNARKNGPSRPLLVLNRTPHARVLAFARHGSVHVRAWPSIGLFRIAQGPMGN